MTPTLFINVAAPMELPSDVAFAFGNTQIYWSGILFAAAILLAILFAGVEAQRKQMPEDTLVDLCIVMIPSGVLGARIWYVISHFEIYTGHALAMLRFWDGGLSVYGAILFALLGLFVYALKKKLPLLRLLDLLAPGLALSQAVLLWGDFFTQRGFGAEVTNPSLAWFPLCVLIERTDTVHLAVFFYESLWCALIFLFLWLVLRRQNRRDGTVWLWYLLLYGAGHAIFNAIRTANTAVLGPFDAIGLVALLVGIAAFLFLIRQKFGALPGDANVETDIVPIAVCEGTAANDSNSDTEQVQFAPGTDSSEEPADCAVVLDDPASEVSSNGSDESC